MERTLYEVLGVARTASAEQIRIVFRRAARTLHPDVNPAPDAADRFDRLRQAYLILSDRHKRTAYDDALRRREASLPASGPARAHYTWTNIADPRAPRSPGQFDFDELYDAFFAERPGYTPPGGHRGPEPID